MKKKKREKNREECALDCKPFEVNLLFGWLIGEKKTSSDIFSDNSATAAANILSHAQITYIFINTRVESHTDFEDKEEATVRKICTTRSNMCLRQMQARGNDYRRKKKKNEVNLLHMIRTCVCVCVFEYYISD